MARSAAVSRSGGEAAAASALDQVDQLREAFATLSDVLVDELDAIRTEAARRWELAEAHLNRHAQALKALKAEISALHGEMAGNDRMSRAEERLESVRGACAQVASEVVAVGGAQRLLQLEIAQSAADGERAADALSARLESAVDALGHSIDIQRSDTDAALSALDRDVGVLRDAADDSAAATSKALDVHKEKLLQCATAIEKEHAAGRDLAQRCDSLAATQALIQQQLQDRLESSRKENARWRSGVEESVKAAAAELAAVRLAHARAGAVEPFPEAARVELRRLLDERDEAHRQQLESLGRAVHSLAGGGHASDRLR